MHEIRVSIGSPEAADHGVAELWSARQLIGYTILEDTDPDLVNSTLHASE